MKAIRNLSAVMLVLAVAVTGACSKSSNKVTNPNPGPAKELNSGNIGPGGNFVHTFNTAGVFGYHCSIHPVMVGDVTVQAGSPTTPVAISIQNMTATAFNPGSITVGPGTQVTWTNNDGTTHTVTSD
jgi:plastocyanin